MVGALLMAMGLYILSEADAQKKKHLSQAIIYDHGNLCVNMCVRVCML